MSVDDNALVTAWLQAVDRAGAALEAVKAASRAQEDLEAPTAELSAALAELQRLADILDGVMELSE